MKTFTTQLIIAASLTATATIANAGFLFETAPAAREPVLPIRAAATEGAAIARNVDLSARLDRVAKMNRQRIDLESRLSSRITQSGETPPELGIIRGMGRDVSFEDALRQVLPNGWSAYSDQDLPLDSKVNWAGNRTWPMVLHGLLSDRDMRAHIDWKAQEVMFFVPALKEAITTPVAGALGVEVRASAEIPAQNGTGLALPQPASLESSPEQGRAAVAAAVPAVVAAAAQGAAPTAGAAVTSLTAPATPNRTTVEVKEVIWTLSPDHTLRENLRRWASAANWNLVWNAVRGDSVIDYPVDAKVEFSGELLGSSGAMAKVITAYRDADYPLSIEFFRGNRVVEIRLHHIPDVKANPTDAPALVAPRVPVPAKPQPPVYMQPAY